MTDSADHDPKTDPRLLDKVSDRTVEYVTFLGTVIYTSDKRRTEGQCSLKAWRRWARNKDVVRTARKQDRRLEAGQEVEREINALTSRLSSSSDHFRHDEVLDGLTDLALALLHHHDTRRLVRLDMLRQVIHAKRTRD